MNAIKERPPYQQRVVEEQVQLTERVVNLNAFIKTDQFRSLPEAEQLRLQEQARYMAGYLLCLDRRIAAFQD